MGNFYINLIKNQLIEHSFIYIDTCSLLADDALEFLDAIQEAYQHRKTDFCKVIIHEAVVSELKKLSSRIECKNKCVKILDAINNKKYSCLNIVGQKEINFGDLSLYRAISAVRTMGTVLLVTEDNDLAYDCMLLNKLRSQKGKTVSVVSLKELR